MNIQTNQKINEATDYYVDKVTELQTFPAATIRMMQLINNDNTTVDELEIAISVDPVMVSRLLRLVNSVALKGREEIKTIKESIVRVGLNNLRELVTADLYREVIKETDTGVLEDKDFSFKLLWNHSLTVAILSKIIAKLLYNSNGEREFMTGILHDIGLLIIIVTAPVTMTKVIEEWSKDKDKNDFLEIEMKHLNTNHCLIGAKLCSQWNLPSEAKYAIKNHHSTLLKTDVQRTLQLANYIADRKRFSAILQGKAKLNSMIKRLVKGNADKLRGLDGVLRKEMNKVKDLYDL